MSYSDSGADGFFYSQDYYLDADNEQGYDLTVVLTQKFSDEVTIVPIIEIRGTELDEVVTMPKTTTPQCKIFCEIAGNKSYNEMTLNVVVPYGTVFKLWLYKKGASKQNCLNYEVTITNKVLIKETKSLSS